MGVKEKDLQTIEQLSDGDKLRVVTSDGNSRNISADVVSGDVLIANLYETGETVSSLDKTWQQIHDAYVGGSMVLIRNYYEDELTHEVMDYLYNVYFVGCDIIPGERTDYKVVSYFSNGDPLQCNSPDGYPSITFD